MTSYCKLYALVEVLENYAIHISLHGYNYERINIINKIVALKLKLIFMDHKINNNSRITCCS